jgi:hypothetical protein
LFEWVVRLKRKRSYRLAKEKLEERAVTCACTIPQNQFFTEDNKANLKKC